MLMSRSKLSSPVSRISARSIGATPALFTSTSSRPNFSRVKSISFLRSPLTAISAWQISARMTRPAALAKIGCDLVVNYAGNEAAAQRTAKDCLAQAKAAGRVIRAEICQADIAVSGDRKKLIDFTREKFGRLDVLVNNAGVAPIERAD